MNLRQWVKYWWQRRTRGWDDREVWDLNATIAEFAIPRIRRLAEIQHCYPADISAEEWSRILGEIIWFLEQSAAFATNSSAVSWFMSEEGRARYDAASGYWGKYFGALWD